MREHVKELLRLVEHNVPGEFDKGTDVQTEIIYQKGDTTTTGGVIGLAPVKLDYVLEYDFQIDDKPDMFNSMHELANKYQEAVSELSVRLAKLAKEGTIVTRPLTTTVPGGIKNEDGSISYTDWDVKPRPGSTTTVMSLEKLWLRHEQRYDSRKKAIIVEIDILYGILT